MTLPRDAYPEVPRDVLNKPRKAKPMTVNNIRDKLDAIGLISPAIASWARGILETGTWADVQAEWRKLELLILGDRRKRH